MTTETTIGQEPAAGSADAVTDEQLIAMLVDRYGGVPRVTSGELAREVAHLLAETA